MAREITYLTDVFLITCVVESGIADKIINAATSVGAQGLQSIMREELVLEIEWAF